MDIDKQRIRKLLVLSGAEIFEQYAVALDLTRLPLIRKKQDNLIRKCYMASNKLRVKVGEKPKLFKRLKEKGVIEEIT